MKRWRTPNSIAREDLYQHGAMALNDMQVAEDTEAKAKITVETTMDHLRVLGADPNNPSAIVDVRAPASGVITDQQVTAAAGTQGLGFTECVHHFRPLTCLDSVRRL